MDKQYSIVMEVLRVIGAAIFWAVTLPIALLLLPIGIISLNIAAWWQRGVAGPTHFRRSPITV